MISILIYGYEMIWFVIYRIDKMNSEAIQFNKVIET